MVKVKLKQVLSEKYFLELVRPRLNEFSKPNLNLRFSQPLDLVRSLGGQGRDSSFDIESAEIFGRGWGAARVGGDLVPTVTADQGIFQERTYPMKHL